MVRIKHTIACSRDDGPPINIKMSCVAGADEVQNKFAVYLAERQGNNTPLPVLRKFDNYLMHCRADFCLLMVGELFLYRWEETELFALFFWTDCIFRLMKQNQ